MDSDSLISSYRKEDFRKISKLLLIWLGTPLILFWSIVDYQEFSIETFSVIFRSSHLLFTVGCIWVASLPMVASSKRLYQYPILSYSTYQLLFCCYYVSISGYYESKYLLAIPQILLAMAFFPLQRTLFIVMAAIHFVVPLATLSQGPRFDSFYLTLQSHLFITYSIFAVITFFVVDHIRTKAYQVRAEISIEKANQNLVIKSQEEEISKAEVFKAIAQTTQMLAHDVRKPFSMMEALIEMVGDLKDPQDIQDTLQESLPSVSQAIISVNGMIQDVMEIGAKSAMTARPVPARKFVKEVLEQLFQYREDLEIALSYDLPSNLYFEIDDIKFSRVFSNIIGNAVEHMKGRGKIWLHADNPIDGRSTFIIGNSDSFIDEADLERLFEAFFTKNKTGGTGLGLAIAKKVIEAHAGTISCRSDPAVGTEFVFTIPAVLKERSASIDLYSRVKDYYREPKQIKRESALEMSAEISRDIAAANLSLAIVDDELIYITTVLGQLKAVSTDVDSTSFSTCEALITAIENKTHPSIVILDVDLGSGHSNGFECCRKLRKIGFTGILCIHSNRGRLVYQPLAIEAGADFFVPKPMSKLDLLNMLSTAATRLTNDHLTVPTQDFSKAVLLFEDEGIFQRRWKKVLGPVRVLCFDSWLQFMQDYPSFDWSTLSFVIMDLHLAHDENGIDVALNIKKLAPDLKIYLSSNAEDVDLPRGLFAAIVGKDPAQALRRMAD